MNRNRARRIRTVLLALLFLTGLVAVPVVLTWREVRQERLNQALIAAVDHNNVAGVRRLLHAGADPDAPILDDDYRPVWKRVLDVLRHRKDLRIPTQRYPLLEAVRWDNAEMVQALVDAGANINCHGGQWRATPLIAAAGYGRWPCVKVLLTHNADVNARSGPGFTSLMYTAYLGNTEGIEALLEKGADINARDNDMETALFYAVRQEKVEQVRKTMALFLRYGASVKGKNSTGLTVLTFSHNVWHDKQLDQMLKQAAARR